MNAVPLYRACFYIGFLALVIVVTACSSTNRHTEPDDDDVQVSQVEPESDSDNPRDREADELRDRDTQAVIDRLNEEPSTKPAPRSEPNDRPGRQHNRTVDQPRPSSRR